MDSGTLSDVAKKDADPDAGDEQGDEESGIDALRLLPAVVWAFCCQCTLFDLADRVLGWDVVGSYVDAHAFLFQTAGALLLAAGLASALLPGASLPRRPRPSLAAAPRDGGGPLEEAGGVAAALAGLLHALSALPAHWSASTGLLLLALAAILLASPAATAGFRRRPGLPPAGCSWALAAAALAALRRSLGALRPLLGSPVFKVAIGGLAFCCAAALALDARVSRRRRGGGRRPAAAAAATGAEGPAPQKEDESLNAAPQTEAENLVADSIPSDPAEVDGELFEAMRFAVGKHHPATVRQLLKYAPDPLALLQKRDEDGNTLLHTAGSDEPGAAVCDTMSCLLRGRADVAAKNILGETPLLMAMRASMDFSSTPRSRAADACDDSSDSSLQAVRCLLEQRADANVVDELNGETPLVEAACRGCAAMCRLLLEFGADPRLETTNGVTALNFAAGAAIKRLLQAAAGMEVDPAEEDVPAHESSEPTSPPSAGFNGHAAAQEANGQDCEEPGEEADEGSEASSAAADEAEEDSSPGKSATPDFEPFNRPNPNFAKSAGGFSKVGASLPRFVSAGTFCGGKPMGGPNRPIFAVGPKPMGMPNQRAAFPGTGLNHGPRPNSMPGFSFATPGGRFMPGGMMSGFSGPNSMPGPGFRPPPVFGGARPSGPAGRGGYGGYDGFPSWAKPKFSVPPKESLFRPPPPSAAAERHYRVLGLRPGAKADDVRRAYRKLALQYHPDKNSDSAGATEKFREIKEAYEAICKLLA